MLPLLFQSTVTVPTRSIPINQTKSKLNQANADAGNWIWIVDAAPSLPVNCHPFLKVSPNQTQAGVFFEEMSTDWLSRSWEVNFSMPSAWGFDSCQSLHLEIFQKMGTSKVNVGRKVKHVWLCLSFFWNRYVWQKNPTHPHRPAAVS